MRSTTYFEVAAQLLPVLMLVVVVEFRIFGGTNQRGTWWVSAPTLQPGQRIGTLSALFVVAYCGLFFFAEMTALDVLREGKGTEGQADLVELALYMGVLMVFFVPAQPFIETLLDRTPLYRAKIWLWRKTGSIRPGEPDPPRAGEIQLPEPKRRSKAK